MSDLTIAAVQEAVASRVPDRDCIVESHRRISYARFTERTEHLANYLMQAGFGAHTPREALQGSESGQDHIGLLMYNCAEYLESEFAVLKSRAAAINVNFRYVPAELAYLFVNAGLRGLIYHSEFASNVEAVRSSVPTLQLLIQVRDHSGTPLLPGAVWFENAMTAGAATPFLKPAYSIDDLHILYTGGTTGKPKGVLWRQCDVLKVALGGVAPDGRENDLEDFVRCAEKTASRTLPAGPFMHASGRWPAMGQLLVGNTVVLPANTRRLDPDDVWSTAEREKVTGINIAGDAFAVPLLKQLKEKAYDLAALRMISSGAAVLSPSAKRELLILLPGIAVSDTIGASETGPQASAISRSGDSTLRPHFTLTSRTTILNDDRNALVPLESRVVGWLARSGRVPLGYLGDSERTRMTFPIVDGVRYVIPGDRARWNESGKIDLLGRDAAVINSGGEKVFAEEVEVALKQHPSVYDAIVCGRPNERWGQEVVAIVRLWPDKPCTAGELMAECGKHVARYKVPKLILFRDTVQRSVSGKPDYAWARATAAALE